MTNEARDERIYIKDRQLEILDDMDAMVAHMRKYNGSMHPDEMERCWETLVALNRAYDMLGEQWDVVVFGEVMHAG